MSKYKERQADGQCTYPGCELPAADGADLCHGHHAAAKARKRSWISKQRARWRKKGRCTRCGRKRAPSSKWGCPKCLNEVRGARPRLVDQHVDKRSRIAARTAIDKDGRRRYRGQSRRGAPSRAATDEADIADIRKGTLRTEEGLSYASSDEVQALPRIQREEARQAALSWMHHVYRTAKDMLERNRYPLGDETDHPTEIDLTGRKDRR
jgi:hypothetical protein